MKESSTDKASNIDRIRSWARGHAYGGSTRSTASNSNPILPINNTHTNQDPEKIRHVSGAGSDGHQGLSNGSAKSQDAPNFGTDTQNADRSAPSTSQVEGTGSVVDENGTKKEKQNVVVETYYELKKVVFHSWINLFLVFVPVGIAIANIPNRNAGATFGINAVAIIPLAALLSHATESVARKMGDTIGALLNVTFGNAVELIIL